MFAYVVNYRLDTEDTKEKHFAVVMASDKEDARNKINAFNANENTKACIYIYSIELMDENGIFDAYEDDMTYEERTSWY